MPYGYNQNMPQPVPQNVPQNIQQNIPQVMQQTVQPLFPQPQGNVYQINSTLEVANVPVGAGMSIALCLPENVMYIKTMQNGNPLFYPYKIEPLNGNQETTSAAAPSDNHEDIIANLETIIAQLKLQDERIGDLEKKFKKVKTEFDL